MNLNREYILNALAEEHLWEPGRSDSFVYGDWYLSLKREADPYTPFMFSVTGQRQNTNETISRRYVNMEKAFLHILNHFNENARHENKYFYIDELVLSSIKELPAVDQQHDERKALNLDEAIRTAKELTSKAQEIKDKFIDKADREL